MTHEAYLPPLGQAKHMFANDILLDLARATANGGRKAVEIRPVPIAIIDSIFVANIIARARALELQREFS